MLGMIIGAVIVLVAVCVAEPNYRNIVEHETIEKIQKTLPKTIPVHIKDMSGKEWDIAVPVNILASTKKRRA